MASTSSLLKSAAATRKTIQAQQDAEVNFEWENSAQTYDDYLQYSKYLDDQAKDVTDPSQALSYETKQRSALSAYTSNEIQRQTQSVIEGRSTLQDKMQTVQDLYQQAVASGNMNLAQNLVSTWDGLSVQFQNEQQAAATAARANTAQFTTDFKNQVNDTVDTLKSYLGDLGSLYQKTGTKGFQEGIQQYAEALGLDPTAGFFDIYANIASKISQTLEEAVKSAPDAATQTTFQKAFNSFTQDKSLDLPSVDGSTIKVSLDDIQKQIAASQVGETLFTTKQTPEGTVFDKSKTDNYVWGRGADGQYTLIPNYSPTGQNTGLTPVDNEGNQIKKSTYKQLLEKAGFQVEESNGSFFVSGNQTSKLGIPGVEGDSAVQVFIGPDGKLQIVNGQNQAYNIDFDKTGKYLGAVQNQPSAITPLAGMTDFARFNNPYYAANQETFKNLPQGSVGVVDSGLATSRVLQNAIPLKGSFNGISGGTVNNLGLPQFSPQAAAQANLQPAQQFAPIMAPQSTASQQLLSAPAGTQVKVNPLPAAPQLNVAKPAPVPQLKVKGSSGLQVGQAIPGNFNLQGGSNSAGIRLQ